MEKALRPYATAGVALLGASVIAATPVINTAGATGHSDVRGPTHRCRGRRLRLLVNVLDPDAFATESPQRLPTPLVTSPYPLIKSSI